MHAHEVLPPLPVILQMEGKNEETEKKGGKRESD
jgi:hypothetical protein